MPDLLSPLTRDSRRALDNAQRLAKKYRQPAVQPDHLLLGILQLSGCQAEIALNALQVNCANLKARLEASFKLQAKQATPQVEVGYTSWQLKLSAETTAIVNEAVVEATANQAEVDTRSLVLGILRHAANPAAEILGQYGVTLENYRAQAQLGQQPVLNMPAFRSPAFLRAGVPISVHPIFIALVLVMGISGYLTYAGIGNPSRTVFLFVVTGWLVSLALHEFGHALVAYLGGDESVAYKGYLTFNPLKYTHPLLSIVLPVVFMLAGGIGLPGGAVYVNPMAIRSSRMRSLTSAAGPLATGMCVLILALPFLLGVYTLESLMEHIEFWAGLAFLAFLQITAILFNLLPLPGLDGFGILEPFIPAEILQRINLIRPFSLLLLFALFWADTPLRTQFWQGVWQVADLISPDLGPLVKIGYQLFQFWS